METQQKITTIDSESSNINSQPVTNNPNKKSKIPLIIVSLIILLLLCGGVFATYLNKTTRNQNSISPSPSPIQPTTTQTPDEAKSACILKPDPGYCKAYVPSFYFDQKEKKCKEFIWGGCDGVRPFTTMLDCQTRCLSQSWKTYVNQAMQISILYPSNWYLLNSSNENFSISSTNPKQGGNLATFSIIKKTYPTVFTDSSFLDKLEKEYLFYGHGNATENRKSLIPITIADVTVYTGNSDAATENLWSHYYFIYRDNNIYKIEATEDIGFPERRENEIHNQIISTFKFLPLNQPNETTNLKTYINERMGFQVSFTTEWNLPNNAYKNQETNFETAENFQVSKYKAGENPLINVEKFGNKFESEEEIKKYCSWILEPTTTFKSSTIMVDNHMAYLLENVKENKYFACVGISGNPGFIVVWHDNQKTRSSDFDQILATFKFIE